MNYTKKVAVAALTVLVLSLIGSVVGYALRIFIARSMSVEDFGLFYSVLAFFSFLWVIKDFGISSALVKYIPEFMIKRKFKDVSYSIKTSFILQFLLGLCIALPVFILSDYISVVFFHNTKASFLIKIFSIEIALGIVFLKMLLQGFQKILAFSVIEVLRVVVIFIFILVFGTTTIENIAISYFLASLLIQAMMILYVSRILSGLKNSEPPSDDTMKRLTVYGSFIFIGSVSAFIIGYADTVVLTYFRSIYEVGLYQVSVSTSQLLLVFSSSLTVILFPLISEVWSVGKRDEIPKYIGFMMKSIFFFMILVSLVFITFPEIVIYTLFGDNYLGSSLPLQILSFGMIFSSINVVLSVILNAIGQPKKTTTSIIIVSLYNLSANLLVVPIFGIIGAAISTASSYLIGFIILYKYLGKHLNIIIPIRQILIILSGSVISITIIYFMKHIIVLNALSEAVICISVSLAFYFSFFLRFKVFNKSDMNILRRSGVFPDKILSMIRRYFE